MRIALALFVPIALSACATLPPRDPQAAFWQALSSHCGNAYAGALASTQEADADMRGVLMTMHVRACAEDRIAVPFHVQRIDGTWDRSRTWVFTRTDTGIRLKHDHRHEDGSADPVTMYGGDTTGEGTARAQDFPVDAESIALFRREGLAASLTNVWRVEVDPAGAPDAAFVYQLTRAAPSDRLFRVEFDLTQPVSAPPAPWGHE